MSDCEIRALIEKYEVAPGIVEIKGSAKKLALLTLLAVFLSSLGVLIFVLPFIFARYAEDALYNYLLGGIGAVFFGLAALAFIRQFSRTKDTKFRLTADSIWIGTAFKPVDVPWRIVRGVAPYSVESTKMVTMAVLTEDYLTLNRGPFAQKVFAASAALVGYPCLTVSSQMTNVSHDELLALVGYYAQKYSPHMNASAQWPS